MSDAGSASRTAFALVARLAGYAAVLGLSLEAVVRWAPLRGVEAVVREDGPLEIAQCAIAIASASMLAVAGWRRSTLLMMMACACAFAGVRELDGLLRAQIAPGSWKLFAAPIVAVAVVAGWCARGRLVAETIDFVGTPAAWLLFFGATLVLVHAQVLGQKELWNALIPDADARTVKKAFEECSELTGYLMLAAGALEAWLRVAWLQPSCRAGPPGTEFAAAATTSKRV